MNTLNSLVTGVQITAKQGEAHLSWDKRDKWQKESNDWRITLHYQGRRYAFDFWQGKGIKTDPTAEGVLECLLSDASFGLDSFEDYCGISGFDSDSRKDFSIWKACGRTAKRLQTLLGADYQRFMDAERD